MFVLYLNLIEYLHLFGCLDLATVGLLLISVLSLLIQTFGFPALLRTALSLIFIHSSISADLSLYSSTPTRKGSVVVESPLWQQAVRKLLSEVIVNDYHLNFIYLVAILLISCCPSNLWIPTYTVTYVRRL